MSDWRLSRGPYLVAWLILTVLQWAPVFVDLGLVGAMLVGWVAAWQLAKVVPAIGRMRDLGRAPDDAFFGTIVPVANVYLFWGICLGQTPGEERRQKLLARWQGQPSWYSSALPALQLMAKTAGPGLIAVVFLVIPQVLILDRLEAMVPTWGETWSPERLAQAANFGLAISAFLGLYTLVQLAKRNNVTPSSWIPSIFFVPTLWVSGAFLAMGSQSYGTLTPLHVGLVSTGVMFAWHSTVGAAVAILWVLAADAAHQGRAASLSELSDGVQSKLLQVMPAHAGRVQLVWIGGQVIVPGLFYWVYAAYVVMVGTLEEPTPHPITTRSGQLSWGMMTRLVKLCLIYAVLILMTQSVVVLLHGPAVAQAVLLMDASQVPLTTQLLVESLGTVVMWWCTVVLYLFYKARVAQLTALRTGTEAQAS